MRNEMDVRNETATVEQITKIAAARSVNRRHFMAALGMTGAGIATGCSSTASQTTPVAGLSQTDVLNFALNLEYLEATFYSYVVNGTDLSASLTVGSGAVTGNPSGKIAITGTNAAQITDMLAEIYYDESSHVADLLSILGTSAVPRPALNLAAAGPITVSNALSLARQFEDVGVTAYAGAAALLTGTNLIFAAQILAVEGFHAGALRLVSIQNPGIAGYAQADALDVRPADLGSPALAAGGPTAGGGFFTTSGASTASSAAPAGFAFTRTTSQVLSIVYNTVGAGMNKGGFFPNGMNGLINTI